MTPGHAYLIHCGDWHTFVGRLVQMSSPLTFEFTSVSKIRRTNNGDNWHVLANGKQREACEYCHQEQNMHLNVAVGAHDWVGQTPQEAGIEGVPSS